MSGTSAYSAKYTAKMAHAAVERGAKWLDEKCPDWLAAINLEHLNLGSRTSCTLGQVAECLTGRTLSPGANRFSLVLLHFGKPTAWATECGFDVPESHPYGPRCTAVACNREMFARYEMLTIAWREYIRRRLEAAS